MVSFVINVELPHKYLGSFTRSLGHTTNEQSELYFYSAVVYCWHAVIWEIKHPEALGVTGGNRCHVSLFTSPRYIAIRQLTLPS